MSNITNIWSGLAISAHASPLSTPPVSCTAAISKGNITGKHKTGNITSRERVFTAIAANTVPTDANPNVARKATSNNRGWNKGISNNTAKTGYIKSSMSNMKMSVPSIFPK